MKHPEEGNIQFFCEHHAPKPREEFEEVEPQAFVGRHVKLCFKEGRGESQKKEHMWVKVLCATPRKKLQGKLDNVPVLVVKWKLNDLLTFTSAEVEEVLPPFEKGVA
jgi:hypothetical protein